MVSGGNVYDEMEITSPRLYKTFIDGLAHAEPDSYDTRQLTARKQETEALTDAEYISDAR